MLTYRLNALNDVVDYFILVESKQTHVGNSKPLFYNENKSNIQLNVSNANYLDLKDLKLVNEFDGSNNWVMINSGVPHQTVGINLDETRTTVCFRFTGNPRFESLIKNAKS
jgi:hypothetical protein